MSTRSRRSKGPRVSNSGSRSRKSASTLQPWLSTKQWIERVFWPFWKKLPVSFCTSHLATFSSMGDQEGIWVHVVRSYTDEQAHVLLGQLSDSRSFCDRPVRLHDQPATIQDRCRQYLFGDVVRVSHPRRWLARFRSRSPRCKQTTATIITPDDRRDTEVECHVS